MEKEKVKRESEKKLKQESNCESERESKCEPKRESKDVTQKNLEAFPDVAADILNVFIYGGEQAVRAGTLLPASTETTYAAPGSVLRSQLEDVSKYELQGGRIRAQYLLANQTERDRGMILRKAGYVGAAYREQYDGKVPGRFPVIHLLLYWGEGHWKRGRTVKDFFGKSELSPQLWEMLDDMQLHVFEMRSLPPEVRERFQSDMRLVVDYLAEGTGFRSDRPVVHKEALIRLLRALGGDQNVEDTALILEEMNVREEDTITMCELFDQYTRRGMQAGLEKGRQEGRREGRQEGRQEGKKEGICETIIKSVDAVMKNFGLDLQKACTGVGISVEEYARAKEQLGTALR